MQKSKLQSLIESPFLFWLYKWNQLPTLWFWGVKVKSCSAGACEVMLPYTWFSKNPFRSVYFAAQCGAAELSTGLLVLLAIEGKPAMSVLVIKCAAEFVKKAAGPVHFRCHQGEVIQEEVSKAATSGEAHVVSLSSEGTLADGTVVCRFEITWSVKKKS